MMRGESVNEVYKMLTHPLQFFRWSVLVLVMCVAPVASLAADTHSRQASIDYRNDIQLIRNNAENGDSNAQATLGFHYLYGDGVNQDFAEAFRWFYKANEQGSSVAQAGIGLMYAQGYGVSQDNTEAAKWYLKAAENGLADAQVYIGLLYSQGDGITHDFAEAIK